MEMSCTVLVEAPKERVWDFYADIEKWYLWEHDLKDISLDKGFKMGSVGVMELEGMPPLEYQLTQVKEYESFWDTTKTPFGNVMFGHEIKEIDPHKVYITHTVGLEGDKVTEEIIALIKQIFNGVPDAMMALKQAAEA